MHTAAAQFHGRLHSNHDAGQGAPATAIPGKPKLYNPRHPERQTIVICPSTEANLGDGVFDYSSFAPIGDQWSIGSDSHVTRRWSEEPRQLGPQRGGDADVVGLRPSTSAAKGVAFGAAVFPAFKRPYLKVLLTKIACSPRFI